MDEKGNKTGGRRKGTPNKITSEAREIFIKTLEEQSQFISEAFDKGREESPTKYLDLFAKYAQYFVPRKTESTDTVKHDFSRIDMNDWK